MNTIQQTELNLARKWRPKNFAHIIGQDIPVRMLKNGLFLKKFFPVYLFAGQRGCGKTSTARVFGAAVNCKALEDFQKTPTISIPCLTCDSCKAMTNGHHPDFIEIDAASHTGVDNIRQIIDSSSYMPLLGQKKIYLIDEAHMLSKAAFNAFLKILEEPPMSVLFILATTETQKIPQTVLSRCFQVVFSPIDDNNLKSHLQVICKQENITIDDSALDLLLSETEGCARDAINLLERVRFACTNITDQTMLSVLGKISNQELYTLFEYAIDQQATQLLEYLHKLSFQTMSPQLLWDMLAQLCRTIMWIKYGATSSLAPWIKNNAQLNQLANKCSIARLHDIFQLFWTQEELFFKTNKKHAFLEMVLLQICQQVPLQTQKQAQTQVLPSTTTITTTKTTPAWALFVQKITETNDALLASIFAQAKPVTNSQEKPGILLVELNSSSKFFKDKLEECKKIWLPLFNKCFTEHKDIDFQDPSTQLTPPTQPTQPYNNTSIEPRPQAIQAPSRPSTTGQFYKKSSFTDNIPTAAKIAASNNLLLEPINIDDKDKWPLANLIISHFPGKIKKLKE